MSDEKAAFEGWAMVEIMGHRKLAGMVREETLFGTAMCRIDVPAVGERAAFTQYIGGGSIYAMTPVSEQVARGVAAKLQAVPISVYDLPAVMRDPQARLALSHDPSDVDDED